MWQFLTTISTELLHKESYMAFITGITAGILIGALATYVYFSYTGSTLLFKKVK